ncbi:hypothetical protein QFZ91_005509 [Paraburkholderia sp. JPY419]
MTRTLKLTAFKLTSLPEFFMNGQRGGYVRDGTFEQSAERQPDGITLDRIFADKALGKETKRPQLALLLSFVRVEDTLGMHSMDRLAENLDIEFKDFRCAGIVVGHRAHAHDPQRPDERGRYDTDARPAVVLAGCISRPAQAGRFSPPYRGRAGDYSCRERPMCDG